MAAPHLNQQSWTRSLGTPFIIHQMASMWALSWGRSTVVFIKFLNQFKNKVSKLEKKNPYVSF